jgi:ADP-ribose pyrophosphatase YjhB (NUDIX family)
MLFEPFMLPVSVPNQRLAMKNKAGVLLYRQKRGRTQVLLVHNGKNWGIPKGNINQNESRSHAAARELEEETGLEAPKDLQALGYVDKRKSERIFCFLGFFKGGSKPKPFNEIQEARFIDLDVAMKYIDRYQLPLLQILLGLSRSRKSA